MFGSVFFSQKKTSKHATILDGKSDSPVGKSEIVTPLICIVPMEEI